MPKTNFCKPQPANERPAYFKEMLMGGIAHYGMMMKDLSAKTGICESTLSKRKHHPETVTLGELWEIVDILKPDEELIKKILLKGGGDHG